MIPLLAFGLLLIAGLCAGVWWGYRAFVGWAMGYPRPSALRQFLGRVVQRLGVASVVVGVLKAALGLLLTAYRHGLEAARQRLDAKV